MSEDRPLDRLLETMARLRDPNDGCEWDRVQTFASIAPYTIEEAYEVADACKRGDPAELKDELGDLLLQVVFHSRIAEEAGLFRFEDVAAGIVDKLERRHPHIFRGAPAGGHHMWEAIKAEERAARTDRSAMAGVAKALPALSRAEKLGKRAALTGFDWPDLEGVLAKIDEERDEVALATNLDERSEEIGDLLFAVVNLARHLNVDPETALRHANDKFEGRFREMERVAGDALNELTLEEKEALWRDAKRVNRAVP